MHRIRRAPRARRGGVLVLSLVAAGVVAMMCVAFLQLNAAVTRGQTAAVDTKAAFYLAEAGLAEAYAGMMVGRTGSVGSASAPARLGDGLFWVEARELDARHVELEAIGMARSGKARLGLVVERGGEARGALGVFSESDLLIGDGTRVDGYDSASGDYATQAAADPESVRKGRLASNGDVTVVAGAAGTQVHGDVVVGPGGALHQVGAPSITGTTSQAAGAVTLAPVVVPEIAGSGAIVQPAGAALYVPAGALAADALVLQPDAQVVLQGPLAMVVGSLEIAEGAELAFDVEDGEVRLFVEGAVTVAPGGALTTLQGDPTRVEILIAGAETATLHGDGAFHGLIYAPDATVDVGAGLELFGAVAAEALVIEDGARLHHDVALVEDGAEQELPHVLAWRILELPEASPDLAASDPFKALGVDPAALPAPRAAHADQVLTIVYVDTSSATQTYVGPESAFDWSLVRQVVLLLRAGGVVDDDIVQLAALGVLNLRL